MLPRVHDSFRTRRSASLPTRKSPDRHETLVPPPNLFGGENSRWKLTHLQTSLKVAQSTRSCPRHKKGDPKSMEPPQ